MRRVLKNHDEVCHVWAQQTQSEGRAGNGLCLGYAWVGFIRFAIFHMLRYMIAYSIPHFVRLTLFNPYGYMPITVQPATAE